MSYVRHLVLVLVLFLILAFAGHFPQAQRAARGFRPEAVRSWLFPQRGLVPRRKICITRGALEVKIAPARPESPPFLGACCGKKEAWSTKKEETAVIARSQVRACVESQVVETLTTALFTQPRRDASVGKSALNKISNAPSSSRRVIPVSRGRWAICAPEQKNFCVSRGDAAARSTIRNVNAGNAGAGRDTVDQVVEVRVVGHGKCPDERTPLFKNVRVRGDKERRAELVSRILKARLGGDTSPPCLPRSDGDTRGDERETRGRRVLNLVSRLSPLRLPGRRGGEANTRLRLPSPRTL